MAWSLISRALPYLLSVAVVFAIGASGWRLGVDQTEAAWQSRWDKHALADTEATATAQAEQRAIEAMRAQTITKVTQDAQHAIDQARTDAADAATHADSLRDAIDQGASRLASSEASLSACTTDASKAAARFTRVLADVLKSADRTAGIMAAEADQSRVRGLACEAAYDGLVPTNQPIE